MEFAEYFTALSNWGRWGDDDELGTLNFVTHARRQQATALVRDGLVTTCARPIAKTFSPANPKPIQHFMISSGDAAGEGPASASDWFGMRVHGRTFTHLDALCHFFWNGQGYNGRSAASMVTTGAGASFGTIVPASLHGFATRGVLLDLPRFLGVAAIPADEPYGSDLLQACAEAQRVEIRTGDALLIRTGRDSLVDTSADLPARPGLDPAALPWLHHNEISVLGADWAHEIAPKRPPLPASPIHCVAIVAMGLWMLDNAELGRLARACAERERWEFLFLMSPLSIPGGTGSPVNPIAVL